MSTKWNINMAAQSSILGEQLPTALVTERSRIWAKEGAPQHLKIHGHYFRRCFSNSKFLTVNFKEFLQKEGASAG
jgi:hypothetical protein